MGHCGPLFHCLFVWPIVSLNGWYAYKHHFFFLIYDFIKNTYHLYKFHAYESLSPTESPTAYIRINRRDSLFDYVKDVKGLPHDVWLPNSLVVVVDISSDNLFT